MSHSNAESVASEFNGWWMQENEEARVNAVIAHSARLENESRERFQANLRHVQLYENMPLQGVSILDAASSVLRQYATGAGLVTFNVVAACIDTLAAKVFKNKPRPVFLTSGGSWPMQQKAKQMDKFMRGLFYDTDVHEAAKPVGFDALKLGTGMLHVFANEEGRLEVERVLPDELDMDSADAQHGKPRVLYRRKTVQREVLVAMFPEHKERIMRARIDTGIHESSNALIYDTYGHMHVSSPESPMVKVIESWHLASGKGAKDGKHIIAIEGVELFCEEWKAKRFPFVPLRFKKRHVGFWGKGISEALIGIQLEMNRLVRSISEQLRRKGRGRIFVPIGSKVVPQHMTNGIGDIIQYTGAAPTVDNQNAVAQEEFMQIDRLYQKAFQEVGLSELSAAAKKPSGLDAAVALREFSDIESERFALFHQAWDDFFMEYADLCIELLDVQMSVQSYKVKMPNKRYLIEMDWKDIGLAREAFVMQIFPSSSLPQYPAARYQKVKEMMQDGFIDKPVAQRLLEFPDLEAEGNLGNAAIDDADFVISAILDDKEPTFLALDPYQDAELIATRATAALLHARAHGADEERLEMLRTLINSATEALAPPPMPAGPGMPAPGAPPTGAPPLPPAMQGDVNITAPGAPVQPAVPPVVA